MAIANIVVRSLYHARGNRVTSRKPSESASHERSAHNVIYLACPYTDPDPAVRKARFDVATVVAAELIRAGQSFTAQLR